MQTVAFRGKYQLKVGNQTPSEISWTPQIFQGDQVGNAKTAVISLDLSIILS